VHLTLHGSRSDGRPRDEVGVVLPDGRIQKLRGDRQPSPLMSNMSFRRNSKSMG